MKACVAGNVMRMSDVEATRFWQEQSQRLRGKGSSCLLQSTAWLQATAPWLGIAETASLLKKI